MTLTLLGILFTASLLVQSPETIDKFFIAQMKEGYKQEIIVQ